ncbi:hypothetical protein EYF80_056251 [Liparis tanakae]|uniref:Uncharacterized protein n=1 Tax=Liparis tanakae TaxID=230148 RepID=A0A4Z2EXC9_9TELE|nr:hypothetical protein EYF80_056251 [Liparis tanakae]
MRNEIARRHWTGVRYDSGWRDVQCSRAAVQSGSRVTTLPPSGRKDHRSRPSLPERSLQREEGVTPPRSAAFPADGSRVARPQRGRQNNGSALVRRAEIKGKRSRGRM